MPKKKIFILLAFTVISLLTGVFIVRISLNTIFSSINKLVTTPRETTANETAIKTDDSTNKNSIAVIIKDFKYNPQIIKVKKGTTVTWTNQDEMEHNAMKEHNEEEPHDASSEYDRETGGFNGPMLKKGESWSFTFTEAGVNNYHCAPHPQMKGIVEVVE